MCELFGVTSDKKIRVNSLLKEFYSHSCEHRNGWGLAILDSGLSLVKEPVRALDSRRLRDIIRSGFETASCIAHIRRATIGDEDPNNTHPFVSYDSTGRRWVLAHNGTIFESEDLIPYHYSQSGTTDSERILLFIVDRINKGYRLNRGELTAKERFAVVEEAIRDITFENKVNLLFNDGEFLYVHKNEKGTLYKKEKNKSIVFSTKPLDKDWWEEVPLNRLLVYKKGSLVYEGKKHDNEYIHDEERMKLLFLAYAGL